MLEITRATTIAMLRQYAAENGIDLGNATLRQDIIDIIQAAETKPPENVTETITKTDEAAKAEQPPDETKPPDPPADKMVIKRVLFASRLLMKGGDVAAVHAALIERGLHVGQESVQGIYGAKTAVAVRHFQSKNRLIVDGRVGKFTAAALGFEWEG